MSDVNEKVATRRNSSLLLIAQRIFGNIVIDAFVCEYYNPNAKEGLRDIEYAKKEMDRISYRDTDDELYFHGIEISLVFSNGKTVNFQSREWASMFNPNKETIEV